MGNDRTPSTTLYVPAMAGVYDGLSGLAYPFIRFVTGLWAMPHGAGKLFGWFGGNIDRPFPPQCPCGALRRKRAFALEVEP